MKDKNSIRRDLLIAFGLGMTMAGLAMIAGAIVASHMIYSAPIK